MAASAPDDGKCKCEGCSSTWCMAGKVKVHGEPPSKHCELPKKSSGGCAAWANVCKSCYCKVCWEPLASCKHRMPQLGYFEPPPDYTGSASSAAPPPPQPYIGSSAAASSGPMYLGTVVPHNQDVVLTMLAAISGQLDTVTEELAQLRTDVQNIEFEIRALRGE